MAGSDSLAMQRTMTLPIVLLKTSISVRKRNEIMKNRSCMELLGIQWGLRKDIWTSYSITIELRPRKMGAAKDVILSILWEKRYSELDNGLKGVQLEVDLRHRMRRPTKTLIVLWILIEVPLENRLSLRILISKPNMTLPLMEIITSAILPKRREGHKICRRWWTTRICLMGIFQILKWLNSHHLWKPRDFITLMFLKHKQENSCLSWTHKWPVMWRQDPFCVLAWPITPLIQATERLWLLNMEIIVQWWYPLARAETMRP